MFITFEGIDGSGKTTALDFVERHLRDIHHIKALVTSELRGTDVGKEVLKKLTGEGPTLSSEDQIAALMTARYHHAFTVINPALEKGDTILCDRYIHSTLAYQGHAGGLGINTAMRRHEPLNALPWPDMIILIDVEPKTAKRRLAARGDQDSFDAMDVGFFIKVREGYINALQQFPGKARTLHLRNEGDLPALRMMLAMHVDALVEDLAEGHAA